MAGAALMKVTSDEMFGRLDRLIPNEDFPELKAEGDVLDPNAGHEHLQVSFAKNREVMRDVAGSDISKSADGHRVVTGDAAF